MGNPKLPPEIWLMIFRFATATLDTQAVDSGFVSDLDGSVDLDTHWRMVVEHPAAKLPLAVVCRTWCNLVTPLVYEQIVIKDLDQENLLLRTLDTSPRKLGHYVKALLIGVGVHVSLSVVKANLVVTSILSHTPKLKVYGFRCAHIFGQPIGCTGFASLTPSHCQLSSLTLHTHAGVVPLTLYEFLEVFSASLRTLETSLPRISTSEQSGPARKLHFPKLHTLTIVQGGDAGGLAEIARTWIMPALRCLRGLGYTSTFPFSIFPSISDPISKPICGGLPNITSVMYTGPRVCNNFHETITAVEELVLDVEIGRRPLLLFPRPIPTCTRVGISTHEVPEEKRRLQVSAISDQFTPLSNPVMFPKLRVIKVMFLPSQDKWIAVESRPSVAFFNNHKRRVFWAYWTGLWARRGVTLEAVEPHTGKLVSKVPELEDDPEDIAVAYERFWGHRTVGHGEGASDEEDSSEDLFSDEENDDASESDSSEDDGDSDGSESGSP